MFDHQERRAGDHKYGHLNWTYCTCK